jgi:hypothetical protein
VSGRAFRPSAAALAPLAALALLAAPPAHAQSTVRDYDPGNPEWNGLSELVTIASAQGLEVGGGDHVDWAELDPDRDLLVVLYPEGDVDAGQLTGWLQAGGHVLLADDFGKLDRAFAELGLERRPGTGVHAARWHEDNPALPVAAAWDDDHPLAEGANELYTNHPAMFTISRGQPDVVFGFGKGEAVVVAGRLGAGRFVALADPSVLINGMLAFDENRSFAHSLLGWLTPPDGSGGRVVLLFHAFLLTGQPPARFDGDLGLPALNKAAHDGNRWLAGLSGWIGDDQALRALAVLCAFALVLIGMAALPLGKRERLDGSWTRAHGGHTRIDIAELVDRFDRLAWNGSYALPAAVLREHLEVRLQEVTGALDPLGLPTAELERRVAQVLGPAAASAAADCQARLRSLPTRDQAYALFQTRVVSRREFERVYDAAQALVKNLPGGS